MLVKAKKNILLISIIVITILQKPLGEPMAGMRTGPEWKALEEVSGRPEPCSC